jgi:phospholipid/cholesterol/gamma-HCH transport system ATP-binding protein
MIEIAHLSKSFEGQPVLDDISLRVDKGQLMVVLGESGTGKSVLLKLIMGLLRPDRGSVRIDGQNVSQLSEKEMIPIRKRIGYLFQEGALYDFMNVFENLAFPLQEHTQMKKQEIASKIKTILKIVDLQGIEEKYPVELSGGMKKRVALARSIILDSKLLLCDEPTSGLDPIRSRDISDLIKDVSRKMQCTTVVTSHDIKNSFRIADTVVLLRNGSIVASGTEDQMAACSDPFVKEFIR